MEEDVGQVEKSKTNWRWRIPIMVITPYLLVILIIFIFAWITEGGFAIGYILAYAIYFLPIIIVIALFSGFLEIFFKDNERSSSNKWLARFPIISIAAYVMFGLIYYLLSSGDVEELIFMAIVSVFVMSLFSIIAIITGTVMLIKKSERIPLAITNILVGLITISITLIVTISFI